MTAVFLGVAIGLVLGLTGAGGSILAVPLLMAGLGWPITRAATASLLAVATAALVGTGLAWRHSYVRYRAAALMALVGSVMAPAGIWVADRLDVATLTMTFAAVLGTVAVRMFRQSLTAAQDAMVVRAALAGDGLPAEGKMCRLDPVTGRLVWTWKAAGVVGLIGGATGFLSGLLGVGGGFVIVPALRAVTPLSMRSAVATSLMAIALTSTATICSGLLQRRSLPVSVAFPFVVGSVIGMVLGRRLAPRIAGPHLQMGFSILAGFVALLMAGHVIGI